MCRHVFETFIYFILISVNSQRKQLFSSTGVVLSVCFALLPRLYEAFLVGMHEVVEEEHMRPPLAATARGFSAHVRRPQRAITHAGPPRRH